MCFTPAQSRQAADGSKCGGQKLQHATRVPLLQHTVSHHNTEQGKSSLHLRKMPLLLCEDRPEAWATTHLLPDVHLTGRLLAGYEKKKAFRRLRQQIQSCSF